MLTRSRERGSHRDYADYSANKANFLRQPTYGFTQTRHKTKPAVVPIGTETLLETGLALCGCVQQWLPVSIQLAAGAEASTTQGCGAKQRR